MRLCRIFLFVFVLAGFQAMGVAQLRTMLFLLGTKDEIYNFAFANIQGANGFKVFNEK